MLRYLIFFFFWGVSCPLYASETVGVISGFDDVLQQAENTGLIKAAAKILQKDQTFSGMNVLYSEMLKPQSDPKFYLVSAISNWFEGRVEKLLKASSYPSHELYLRNWITEVSIEDFKLKKISKILAKNPNQKFVIVFDNSGPSIAMVDKIQKQFPGRIEAIYLHQISDAKMPTGSKSYYTAFDIALSEYREGRMSLESLNSVGQCVLAETKWDLLFPQYASCPAEWNGCDGLGGEAQDLCHQVGTHVRALCQKRSKGSQ